MMEFDEVGNPFPGLRPFETKEYNLFFGREGQSDELLARLGRTRFLAVVGTSGSGKSSLVRAGLLPALHGGLMAKAGSAWRVALVRPGGDPIGNLARELADDAVLGSQQEDTAIQAAIVEATLRRSALGLVEAARQAHLPADENLLVVVDQFEELFRFKQANEEKTEDDAAAFVKLLLEAGTHPDLPVYVVLTMRSDFLGDCARFWGLPEAINSGQYLIPRMTRDERRSAITGPVAVGGGQITQPLVNRLLNDVGDNPDQLPILQHALMRTWDHWSAARSNGEPVGLEHYEAIGTMTDALSLHADEAFNELSDERSRKIAETLFKALTERGADNREIRRPTRLREISQMAGTSVEEVVAVIDVFRAEGRSFLMPSAGVALSPETMIDISHESLIRNWLRLKDWVNEEAQSARIYRRLAEAAVLYHRKEEGLLSGPFLQIALEWREKQRPNRVWAYRYNPEFETADRFLDASRDDRDTKLAAQERELQEKRDSESRELKQAAALAEKEKRLAEAEKQRAEEQAAARQRELEQAQAFAKQQTRAATRLKRLTFALVLISLLALGAAGGAVYAYAQAKKSEKQAKESERKATRASEEATISLAARTEATIEAEKQRELAKEESKRAEQQATKAEGAKRDAQAAQNRAERAAEDARSAAVREAKAAEDARNAENAAKKLVAKLQFDRWGRDALASFQREDYAGAVYSLHLLAYELKFKHADKSEKFSDRDLAALYGWSLANRGAGERKLGQNDNAIKSYLAALKVQVELFGVKGDEVFDTLHGLGHAYRDSGDFTKAEERHSVAVQMLETTPDLINSVDELPNLEIKARLYRDLGKYAEAEPLFTRVIELRRKRGGTRDEAMVDTLDEVAKFYALQNRWKETEQLYREIAATQEKSLSQPLSWGELAETYNNLGEALRGQEGDAARTGPSFAAFDTARLLKDMLLNAKRSGAVVKVDVNAFHKLARYFIVLKNYGGAEQAYLITLNAYSVVDSVDKAIIYRNLADLYLLMKRPKEAENYYKLLLKSQEESSKPDNSLQFRALSQLAFLYAEQPEKIVDAEAAFQRALGIPTRDIDTKKKLFVDLAALYRKQGRDQDLERVLISEWEYMTNLMINVIKGDEQFPFLRGIDGFNKLHLNAAQNLTKFYEERQRKAEAATIYSRVITENAPFMVSRAGSTFDTYAELLDNYAKLLREMNKQDEAAKVEASIQSARAKRKAREEAQPQPSPPSESTPP